MFQKQINHYNLNKSNILNKNKNREKVGSNDTWLSEIWPNGLGKVSLPLSYGFES
jgi:hypothetical protein